MTVDINTSVFYKPWRTTKFTKNPSDRRLKHVIMGDCWPETYTDYEALELYGHFLSIVGATDPNGRCMKIFEKRKHLASHKEIAPQTG
jgi:hypothetical protein